MGTTNQMIPSHSLLAVHRFQGMIDSSYPEFPALSPQYFLTLPALPRSMLSLIENQHLLRHIRRAGPRLPPTQSSKDNNPSKQGLTRPNSSKPATPVTSLPSKRKRHRPLRPLRAQMAEAYISFIHQSLKNFDLCRVRNKITYIHRCRNVLMTFIMNELRTKLRSVPPVLLLPRHSSVRLTVAKTIFEDQICRYQARNPLYSEKLYKTLRDTESDQG